MVEDVVVEAQRRLESLQPETVADIYAADRPMAGFSDRMAGCEKELKAFLHQNLYFPEKVLYRRQAGGQVVTELFNAYMHNHEHLPDEWRNQAGMLTGKAYARLVSDFLFGMTDNYALREYERLFEHRADLF